MIFFIFRRIVLLYYLCFIPSSFADLPIFHNISFHSSNQNFFQNEKEKIGYALGVSLGNYVNQSFEKQKQIGINLNKKSLLLGIQDAISGNLKLSGKEISIILQKLEEKLRYETQIQSEKSEKENLIQGKLYMQKLSKIDGSRKTKSGLLYFIKNIGAGKEVNNDSKITVHYRGSLIDGTEFDSSYKRGKPITLMLKDVILGWQEGLKYIKKSGKIKLVIPPHLGYGTNKVNGIPGNSTLIFDIELLDIN